MDIATMAQQAVLILGPLLPALVKSGGDLVEAARKDIVQRLGKGAVDVVGKLWGKIAGSPTAKTAAERAAANPDDEEYRTALKVEIRELLKADAGLAAELRQLLEAVRPVVGGNVATASGIGSVAVGGNATGNISTNVNTDRR